MFCLAIALSFVTIFHFTEVRASFHECIKLHSSLFGFALYVVTLVPSTWVLSDLTSLSLVLSLVKFKV